MDAVLDDLETAPVTDALKATLRFLRRLTLDPWKVAADDARAVLAAGVSAEAIEDAIGVCVLWCVIDRVADALGVEPLTDEGFARGAAFLYEHGYV